MQSKNNKITIYQCQIGKIKGSSYEDVNKRAQMIFSLIQSGGKRKAYLKSPYFKHEKVFFDYFWEHIRQKPIKERIRRLKFFAAAIDLIGNCNNKPEITNNPSKKREILYRFKAVNRDKEIFYVQIKKNIKTNSKQFMSVFPGK